MRLWHANWCRSGSLVLCALATAGLLLAGCADEVLPPPPRPPAVPAVGSAHRLLPEAWPQLENIPFAVKRTTWPRTVRECREAGGSWGQWGLPGASPPKCNIATRDARKICTDDLHCEGECLVADDIPDGVMAIGSCSAWVVTYGCYKYIIYGVVTSICAD